MQTRKPDAMIIVDNDPDASAETIAKNATAIASFQVHYIHEPKPGVSNARNAGLAAVKTRYVAFLDDDEIARPSWLRALIETAETLPADVIFGPLKGDAGPLKGVRKDLVERLYSRVGADQDEILDKPFGCGNSLIDLQAFELPDTPFGPALNETGGEDDVFFAMLAQQGARFGWSASARGIETVDPARTRWRYLAARSFAFGQGATQNCARRQNPDWGGVAFWMLIGAAQVAVFAPLAAISLLIQSGKAAEWVDRAIQGIGKIAWFDQFEPRFYGASAASD